MLELMSDDDDETAILASAAIIFSSCALSCNNGRMRKRCHSVCVILPPTKFFKTCLLRPFVC